MNIAEIKLSLSIGTLNLNTAEDKDGKKTDWFRHWDNDTRTAVSIHKDTLAKIQANPAMSNLALQTEPREGALGGYTAKRIVAFTESEVTL